MFTEKQKRVIGFVIKGLTNQQIANEMFVTEITIKKTLSNIYYKFQIKNNKRSTLIDMFKQQEVS